MIRFIIAYLLIYGSVHGLFFMRLKSAFSLKGWAMGAAVVLLLFMVLCPMLSRGLEAKGHDAAARVVAHIGYYWMGFIFYAFWGCICLYLLDILVLGASLCHLPVICISKKALFVGLMAVVVSVMTYGQYEAWHIRTEKIRLETRKLPKGLNGLRIIQVSDIHLGIINRGKFLQRLVEKVKLASPDVLVCTGDLVDGSMVNLMHLADLFKTVQSPLGKFAVTGNHEYYAGLDHAMAFTEKAGFDILRGRVVTIPGVMNVAGVDDGGRNARPDSEKILNTVNNGLFTLYLVHRPDISEKTAGLYDLQLCGHTHNGQIFPFNFIVSMAFPLTKGLHPLKNGSQIYISRGSGTWGPPIRVLSPPEVTVIDLGRP